MMNRNFIALSLALITGLAGAFDINQSNAGTVPIPTYETVVKQTTFQICTNPTGIPGCPTGDCPPDYEYSFSCYPQIGLGLKAHNNSGMSFVDNLSLAYIHWAADYKTPSGSSSGCGPCGGGLAGQTTLSLALYHITRYREVAVDASAFGAGGFSNLDHKLYLYTLTNGDTIIDYFDPFALNTVRFLDGSYSAAAPLNLPADAKDGIYVAYKNKAHKELRLYDAGGALTTVQANAKTAVLQSWSGHLAYFQIVSVNGQLVGRLTRLEDRNGYGVQVTYQYQPGDDLMGSEARLGMMNTATDSHGKQMTFTYKPTQVGGRWVVGSVALPNSTVVSYDYTDAYLSSITLPDGSVSTITRAYNANANATTVTFFDAAAEGSHRTKRAYLSTNFTIFQDLPDEVAPQSAQLIRMVVNGNEEVSYLNVPDPVYTRAYIYEGQGVLKQVYCHWDVKFATNWSLTDAGGSFSFNNVSATFESTSEHHEYNSANSYRDWYTKTPTYQIDNTGRRKDYQYNSAAQISKVTYNDGTTEEISYNQFQQVTRQKDRLNRVSKFSFDARGNMLTKETGILFTGGVDVNQPEHATWTWEYYPTGHPNQFLLKTAFDALYNAGQPDLHRTDYEYNSNQFLTKVTEGADIPGGVRAETIYEYDSAGRLARVKAPPAGFGLPTRDVAYTYDSRNRVSVITHETDIPSVTSEYFVYGTGVDANLLVQKTDRLGRIEKWEYDLSGRQSKHIQAFGLPEQVEKTCTYYSGTDLRATCVDRGDKTEYTYDYRHRQASTIQHPNALTTLTSTNAYLNNQLFRTQDPYGRKSYSAYRSSDGQLVRTIQGTMPSFTLADYTAVTAQARDLGNNAAFLVTDYELDSVGQITAMVDPRNIRHTNSYDSRGQLKQRIEAESIGGVATTVQGKTEFDYDAQGNQIRIRNPRHFTEAGGFISEVAYNGRNLAASRTEAKGRTEEATETYAYTPHKQIYLRTDARGNVWETGYHKCCGYQRIDIEPAADVDGNSSTADTKAAFEANKDSYGHTTHQYVISDVSTLSAPANPGSTLNEATTRLDGLYRSSAQTRWFIELGNVDKNDVPIAGDHGTNVADGLTTKYRYDENLTDGLGIDVDYAAKLSQLGAGFFGAGADGFAVEVTNPNNEKSVTVYDGSGRVVLTIDGNGNTNRMAYDTVTGSGLLETVAYDGLNHTNKQRADGAGRVWEAVDSEGFISTREYDANGNVVKLRDPNGVGLDCVFDARNRDTQCTDTHNDSTRRQYDSNYNVIKIIDSLNKETLTTYDGRDRSIVCIDRIAGATQMVYDKNNNLIKIIDAQSNETEYTYDTRNHLIEEIYPDGQQTSGGKNVKHYSYDASDRLINLTNQNEELTYFEFDRVGRLIKRKYTDGNSDIFTYNNVNRVTTATSERYNNSINRSYDSGSRMISETLLIAGKSYTILKTYDSADREVETIYPSNNKVTRSYSNRGELKTLKWNSMDIAFKAYDNGGRLISTNYGNTKTETRSYQADNLLATIDTPSITKLSYAWNSNKMKVSEEDTGIVGNNRTFSYDNENRLTHFATANGATQDWNLSLAGDWNWTSKNGVVEQRTHNAVHELININGTGLTYSKSGNIVQNKNGHQYQWDHENRLIQVNVPVGALEGLPGVHSYKYDAFGRRICKTVNGNSTVELMDGAQRIAEYVLGSTSAKAEYVFSSFSDEPVLRSKDGVVIYYHLDHLYSVIAITDVSGNILERYSYDAYGNRTILDPNGQSIREVSCCDNDIAFTGRTVDAESGLLFFRARNYDAKLGRFLSRDPYGKTFGWSLYGFGGDQFTLEIIDKDTNISAENYYDDLNLYQGLMGLHQWIDPSGMQGGPPSGEGDVKPPVSGETKSTIGGKAAHKGFPSSEGFEDGRTLPSGKRTDGWKETKKTIKIPELKPEPRLENPAKLKQAIKQVEEYVDEAKALYPKKKVVGELWCWTCENGKYVYKLISKTPYLKKGTQASMLILAASSGDAKAACVETVRIVDPGIEVGVDIGIKIVKVANPEPLQPYVPPVGPVPGGGGNIFNLYNDFRRWWNNQ